MPARRYSAIAIFEDGEDSLTMKPLCITKLPLPGTGVKPGSSNNKGSALPRSAHAVQVEAHYGSELGTLLAAVAKMSRIVQHVGSTGAIGSSAVRKHIEVRRSRTMRWRSITTDSSGSVSCISFLPGYGLLPICRCWPLPYHVIHLLHSWPFEYGYHRILEHAPYFSSM